MQSILDDTRVHYSHNSELDVLYTSGVVGLSCLVIVGIIGIRTALRRLRGEPLAAVSIAALAGTLAASQFDFVFARSIPGALLIVLGLIVLLPRPSSSEWSRRGLGREDDWLDSWMR
jgi:O-antigen ligase